MVNRLKFFRSVAYDVCQIQRLFDHIFETFGFILIQFKSEIMRSNADRFLFNCSHLFPKNQ